MNNSLLNIEDTLNSGDCLAYLMTEAKEDSSWYTNNINGLHGEMWMYQSLNREKLDIIFSNAPEGFIEFLVDNGYIYLSARGGGYLLKSKLRNIISVNS